MIKDIEDHRIQTMFNNAIKMIEAINRKDRDAFNKLGKEINEELKDSINNCDDDRERATKAQAYLLLADIFRYGIRSKTCPLPKTH